MRHDEKRAREGSTYLAALVIANAFIIQERCSKFVSGVPSVPDMIARHDMLHHMSEVWGDLVAAGRYSPIFSLAFDLATKLPNTAEVADSIRHLARQAIEIAEGMSALRHELMSRMHQSLLHDAKGERTHYTSLASAALLSRLAMDRSKWKTFDWSDLAVLREFRVVDLSCGTGALVVTAAEAIEDNHIAARSHGGHPTDAANVALLRAAVVEEIMHGYDVLPAATHSTAAALAMFASESDLKKINVHTLPNGVTDDGRVLLGTLEFLGASQEGSKEAAEPNDHTLPRVDLCIMNPPYMRRQDQTFLAADGDVARTRMQKELSRRLRAANLSTFASAGPGAAFVAVAHQHLKPGGRLALVLPAAALTGMSWQRTRDLFKLEYHVETIVASHDPTRWNFSEDSDFNEILIVARRRGGIGSEKNPQTRVISLWENPATSVQSISIADKIAALEEGNERVGATEIPKAQEIHSGRQKIAEIIDLDWSGVQDALWFGAAFAQTDLVRTAWSFLRGRLYVPGFERTQRLPITQLGNLCFVGPDGREVRDIYEGEVLTAARELSEAPPPESLKKMAVHLDDLGQTASAVSEARGKIALIQRRVSRLMIVERAWMNTQRALCVRAQAPGLSTALCAIRLKNPNERMEKALALWLSSSLGTLALLAQRVPSKSAWVHLKKQSLRRASILDVSVLAEETLDQLAHAFDEDCDEEFRPFSEIELDETRTRIDNKLSRILGLPSFDSVRKLLANEPIVSLRPCGAHSADRLIAAEKAAPAKPFIDDLAPADI